MSLPTVRAWEQEKNSPSHEMLVSICRLYGVSSDFLLGLTNIDPAYANKKRQAQFTAEERVAVRDFKNFLRWKRKSS